MTARRLWSTAAIFAVGWCLGWVVADWWVRGILEDDAPGGLLDFG